MAYCKNCGVELEDDMEICPLCGVPAGQQPAEQLQANEPISSQSVVQGQEGMTRPQRKFIWEIVSITIFSAVLATLAINLIINGRITWSEYPVAICLIVFSYVSIFAFLDQKALVAIIGGFLASSVFLLIIDELTGGIGWIAKFGIPFLFSGNAIATGLFFAIRLTKKKGVNLIAYFFIAAALFCICIEWLLHFFTPEPFHLRWSLIVSACVLPVALVLFYVHYRVMKMGTLERIFHI